MRAWLFMLVVSIVSATASRRRGTHGISNSHPMSPNDLGLEASDNDDLEFPPESPDPRLDPRLADLNATALLRRLDQRFNPHMLSVERPYSISSREYDFPFRKNKHGRLVPKHPLEMPKYLKGGFKSVTMPNGKKTPTIVQSDRLNLKIQTTLWAHTACPVEFRWRDLGKRFWPRYIKSGSCVNDKARSCSIPPGMNCQPAAKIKLSLLRWFCRPRRACSWHDFELEVVNKCECKCPKN
ncbi:noggin-like [Cloeon dipterum]|uniref:noggin-like n=1 Tax=Cloeon dipterum TaxID=197152 RepID=UPI00321FD0DE